MNKQRVLQNLTDFIAIQSVSSDSNRFQEMLTAVSFIKSKLTKIGCEVKVFETKHKPPLILGVKKVPGAERTIGIYGHYDVQPEDPVSEWHSQPYELTRRSGKLFGRGIADNKGHIIQNITAIEELIQKNQLHNNILFLIEGEEETGGSQLEVCIKKYKHLLSEADVFFLTDVDMYQKNIPQIIYSLRGLVYFEIEVSIGETDLHSGVYGNAVYNPIQILSELFAKIKDSSTGKISIPGFYTNIRKLDKEEMDLLSRTVVSDLRFKKEMKTYSTRRLNKIPSSLTPKLFPSMDIHGILSGYTGLGSKTVIPKSAKAKFSFRLIENQNAQHIQKKVELFITKNLPKGVKYRLSCLSTDEPFYTSIDNIYLQKTEAILSSHFKNKTVLTRGGGSIPVAEIIRRILDKPIVITGFVLPDSNLHAPDENMDEDMFWKGIEALKKLYDLQF